MRHERRSPPFMPHDSCLMPDAFSSMSLRHEASVDWKHLAVYGLIAAVAGIVGTVAIWAFIDKQALVIAPEPLPKVTVVTADSHSPLAAAWVRMLTRAELPATLVPLETFDPIEGVV